MLTLTISLDSLSTYIVAVDVLCLLSYILYRFHKKRRLERTINNITEFVTGYFMNTGVEVEVTCCKLEDSKHFVVMIESEPLKRFRYSNILESNLIAHIRKMAGSVVEKIYWRFPVSINKIISSNKIVNNTEKSLQEQDDLYFLEMHTEDEYKVSEVSWDEFNSSSKQIPDHK